MLCRLYPVILAALLISTGGRAATEPASGTQELLGIAGSSLDFGSVYDQVVRQELYSVTLKKSQPTLRVFLSIISSGKMIPSNSYKDRVKFDPDSGSLQLLNFTAGDTGTYQLILTASNGTDFTKSIRVRLYESDGFPFCREEPVLKRKRFHIILIVVSLLVLLHIGIFVWVKKRRNRRMI
ncbi:uncharacterized protein LOC132394382 isoform X3 [Hypanus sabinus]|uniref:uncharacterized protein LOC132394382 isoform X3 n=1 Tax=Hypanus sabinus TaxID=79690 RepID=UPI0028C3BA8E|nr:uncharacterized protein LOC132394382 isoform X3 [Hypanus sabinus]